MSRDRAIAVVIFVAAAIVLGIELYDYFVIHG